MVHGHAMVSGDTGVRVKGRLTPPSSNRRRSQICTVFSHHTDAHAVCISIQLNSILQQCLLIHRPSLDLFKGCQHAPPFNLEMVEQVDKEGLSLITSSPILMIHRTNNMEETKKDWKVVVERKRKARQALLPSQWLIPADELPTEEVYDVTTLCAEKEWLTPEELNITTKTITSLAALIAIGRVSALEVVSAFAHRATIAQQLLNP